MKDIQTESAHTAAAYLYRYLDLDAETGKVDWNTVDGGESNQRIRDLARLLLTGNLGFGPDPLVSAGKKYQAYHREDAELFKQQIAAQADYPCWITNGNHALALFPVYTAICAIEGHLKKLDGSLAAFVEGDTLPGLERVKDALIKFEDDARAKAAGGVCPEAVRDAMWKKIDTVAERLGKDAPVSLQGVAAKIRYELALRVGSEPDDEGSAECQLLAQAAEALEGAPEETLRAA
jgi:hypothetical protein